MAVRRIEYAIAPSRFGCLWTPVPAFLASNHEIDGLAPGLSNSGDVVSD
jgi:hypothetical protein